jgi:DnaJ-class molecular chaperone
VVARDLVAVRGVLVGEDGRGGAVVMSECSCWDDEYVDRGDGVMVCGRCGVAKCSTCNGEGAVGTGLSNSFVDASDAMLCPDCGGSGAAL